MKLRWVMAICLIALLATSLVDAQKRRKGEKKKEGDSAKVDESKTKSDEKKSEGGKHRGSKMTTVANTPSTVTTTTEAPVPEEDIDQEIIITDESRTASNECPPELKEQEGKLAPCTCWDNLDDNALFVECAHLTSAEEMHQIFNNFLLGKRIDGLEVRNSTLGSLVPLLTARAYAGTIFMRGNKITDLVSDTFLSTDQNIGRLDLSSNLISRVNFSIFNGFTHMQVLNLGENQLTNIEDAGAAPYLHVLYLYANQIDTIAQNAFKNLKQLEYLDLRWNRLQVLSPNAFAVSSKRWQIRLRSNQLSSLESAFVNEHLPFLIDLSLNNISSLTDVVYGPLVEMAVMEGKLYLSGNPLQCDCSLAWLAKNSTLLAPVVGAKCDGDGISISDINWEQFRRCPPPRQWYSPINKAREESDEGALDSLLEEK